MENLVQISNNLVVTSSFQVAEHFHKEHRNVLRTIREYINQLKNEQIDNWFYETNYIDDKNREYPMYLMNRDGFSLLVMGFTGSEALSWKIKYINAFNSMEAQLKKQLSKKKKLGITSAIRTNLINGKFKVRDFPKWNEEPRVNVNNEEFRRILKRVRQIISALDFFIEDWEYRYSYCSKFESKFDAVSKLSFELDKTILGVMDINFDVYTDDEFDAVRNKNK